MLEAIAEAPAGDARLAALTLSWIHVHGAHLIVDKLRKFARARRAELDAPIPWLTAVAAYGSEHLPQRQKWTKLIEIPEEPVYLYAEPVTRSAIARSGAVEWLEKVNIVVPHGFLPIKESEVLPPVELIRVNRQYRNRFLHGASWRADIITALEEGISSPTEISRTVGCSYEPAHRVAREWQLVQEALGG